jgi:hypothetical protein
LRLQRGRIHSDPVDPLTGRARSPDRVHRFQQLNRTGDGAAAGQQRVRQVIDRLLGRLADRQVPEQPPRHRRDAVRVAIELPRVVGESQLFIGGHTQDHTLMTEITVTFTGTPLVYRRPSALVLCHYRPAGLSTDNVYQP